MFLFLLDSLEVLNLFSIKSCAWLSIMTKLQKDAIFADGNLLQAIDNYVINIRDELCLYFCILE